MKSKRILAMLLVSTMLFSACGEPKTDAPESTPEVTDNFNPTGYPIVNETITLKGFGNQNVTHKDWNEIYCFTEYEKISNINVEWTTAPNAGYLEKKNVLLASGEYPDIFYRAGLSVSDLVNYGSKGAIIPLNDLIEEHAVNLNERIEDYPTIEKEITMADGNIYSMPTINGTNNTIGARNWINVDWLEAVNMEMPTTLDELEAVLTAFKEHNIYISIQCF